MAFKSFKLSDVTSKLAAPSKKTQWEKQKAEEAAKAARQQEETDAALREFMEEHGTDEGPTPSGRGGRAGAASRLLGDEEPDRNRAFGGGKRHHTVRHNQGQSGPGSLGALGGSGPGSLGPLNTFRKRQPDGPKEPPSRFDRPGPGGRDVKAAFAADEEEMGDADDAYREAERETPKPTLRLASLPPQIPEAAVKAMLPKYLSVVSIKPERVANRQTAQRLSKSMIVTLAQDTTSKDIDRAVNELQRKYLGWGFHLSISRHLSSTALSAGSVHAPVIAAKPFGATERPLHDVSEASKFAPPPEQQMGRGRYDRRPEPQVEMLEQVVVTVPTDLNEIRLINMTVEKLLIHGPEFEALLRKQPNIQQDPRWAFIWDSQSPSGIWYRWQLYKMFNALHGHKFPKQERDPHARNLPDKYHIIFEGEAPWREPDQPLQFMTPTKFEELVEHADYEAADDNSDGEHRAADGKPPIKDSSASQSTFLNPLERSRLIWTLGRLPLTTAKLRAGDIARVTDFAIKHTTAAEEVVEIVISNIQNPISVMQERQNRATESSDATMATDEPAEDTTGAKFVALYALSDILLSARISGVFQAWRYRDLLESGLLKRKVFENLGKISKAQNWGKMRADKWRRSVFNLLDVWEQRNALNTGAYEGLREAFSKAADGEEKVEKKAKRAGGVGGDRMDLDGAADVEEEAPRAVQAVGSTGTEKTPAARSDDDSDMSIDEEALAADLAAAEAAEAAEAKAAAEEEEEDEASRARRARLAALRENLASSEVIEPPAAPKEEAKEVGGPRRRRPQASDLF